MKSAETIILPDDWRRKHLSPAEQRVVELAATGLSTKLIATKLGKSTLTARNQLIRAMRKIGVRSRFELIAQVQRVPARTSPPDYDGWSYAI